MKKIIAIVLSLLLIISCAVTTPNWANIGREGVYVELVSDTLDANQLDRLMEYKSMDYRDWYKMTYYDGRTNVMTQWTNTVNDTIYSVTLYDDKFIYNVKYNKAD
jgi:uncharacterized protein YxeA